MGNCVNLSLSRAEKSEILIISEGEKEFRASKLVKKVTCGPYHGYELVHSLPRSPLPPKTRLEPGKAGCLPPHLVQPHDHSISLKIIKKESFQGRNIKIVITRQQLEFLLGDAKMFQSKKIAVRSPGNFKRGDRK